MAVLQLFGRAPMAAFNSDAAQNRKGKEKDVGGRGDLLFPSLSVIEFLKLYFVCMNL